MQNVMRQAEAPVGQDTTVDATLGIQGVTEAVVHGDGDNYGSKRSRRQSRAACRARRSALFRRPTAQPAQLIPAVQYCRHSVRGTGGAAASTTSISSTAPTLLLFAHARRRPLDARRRAGDDRPANGARAVDFIASADFLIPARSASPAPTASRARSATSSRHHGPIALRGRGSQASADR